MREIRILMGMPITVEVLDTVVVTENIKEAINAVFAYFEYVDEKFSTYKENSEISLINRKELAVEQASSDMQEVFTLCEETKRSSGGYFDIAHNGRYDPSGLVKGWAIQNAATLLRQKGFANFYVEAGGDIEMAGKNHLGQKWRVGIRNPFNPREIVKALSMTDCGVATSGTYVRGQHIYDPRNTDALLAEIVSLTVIGPNIYEADRFATAAFAMGREGIYFIEELEGFEGYLIDEHGQATFTSGFAEYISHDARVIDGVLNRITMYRLTLYYLIFLLGAAVILAFAGVLHLDPYALLFSTAFLLAVCAFTNWLFAKAFAVPANTESVYISALILALIISPLQEYHDLWFLGWAAVWAMASKYIIAVNRKHLFNPVAFAVVLTYFTINQSASWWVGDASMLPFVLLGGLLIVRKIQRFDLVLSFLLTAIATTMLFSLVSGDNPLAVLQSTILYSPLAFFAFIILTEPLTTPPTAKLRIGYGALVGLLFSPQFHIGSFYLTPEMAIVAGNLFSYLVSPKAKLLLTLKKKVEIAPNIFDFIFEPARRLAFAPGQYMEWTLAHNDPDSRGNRRYFTLSSSPTENELRIGVKFYENSSTFKHAMLAMKQDSQIMAGQLAGDFVLLDDPFQKCVFIAGGIGITPFRSMLQYLLDRHERRPIVLFYVNRTADEIVYTNVLNRALRELRIRTVYTLTDPNQVPARWGWRVGHMTEQMLAEEVPDYHDCIFYISGPNGMVNSYRKLLRQLDVPDSQIKTDYFPGFA